MHKPLARFGSVLVYACAAVVLVLAAAAPAHAQQTVTATWDRNTDAYTAGYRLYYGTTSGSYQWSVDVGNVTSAPLSLSPGSYYFAVRAYNASYQYGPSSNEATFTVGGGTPPPPTAAIQAVLEGTNTARVTWQTTNAASATINGVSVAVNGTQTVTISATTTFTIVARSASGATATASATVTLGSAPPPTAAIQATLQGTNTARVSWQTTNAVSATINGVSVATSGTQTVTINATTTFTIVARSASGATATASATVTLGSSPPPTAAIQATRQGTNTARVSWQTTNAVSATINGVSVAASGTQTVTINATTTFTIVARSASGATATASATVTLGSGAPTAAIQATLQSPNTARVSWQTTNASAVRLNGSAVGVSGSITVPVTQTTTFTLLVYASSGATATATATVTVGGSQPTAAIQATLEGANTANVTWQTTNAVSATINGVSVALSGSSKLTVTTNTTFELLARAANGTVARATASVNPQPANGPPLAPVGVQANVTGTRVTLNWQRNPSGGAPSDYLVYVGTTASSSNIVNGVSVGNVQSVSSDVPKGTYYVRVRARNGSGVSASSATVSFRVGAKLASPTGLTANWNGTKTTLSWVESSADSPELQPTDYVLEAGTAPGLADVGVVRLGRTTRFTAEVPHGVYYVRVRAINERGDSDPTADLVVAAPGTAAAPQALTSGGTGSTVTLSWSPPPAGAEAPVGYLIEAGSEPGLSDLATVQVGTATSVATEAPPGIYYVRVRAINSRGPGLPSNEVLVQK